MMKLELEIMASYVIQYVYLKKCIIDVIADFSKVFIHLWKPKLNKNNKTSVRIRILA